MLRLYSRALIVCCVVLASAVSDIFAEDSLRDPTRPLFDGAAKVVGKPKLQLQAIYDRDGKKTAVINGRSLKVGDYLGKAKVIKIFSKSVSIELDGRREELVLRPAIR